MTACRCSRADFSLIPAAPPGRQGPGLGLGESGSAAFLLWTKKFLGLLQSHLISLGEPGKGTPALSSLPQKTSLGPVLGRLFRGVLQAAVDVAGPITLGVHVQVAAPELPGPFLVAQFFQQAGEIEASLREIRFLL